MTQAPRLAPHRCVFLWLALPFALVGCTQSAPIRQEPPPEPGVLEATRNGPAGAPPGTCWGKTVSPAVVETVEQQVQVKPAEINSDGTIAALPQYRSTSRQEIVSPRVENWFETPCRDVLTPQFIASLQRALMARGFYAGSANGVFDAPTRTALQNFQRTDGPDSPVLALATARRLGLIAVARVPSE